MSLVEPKGLIDGFTTLPRGMDSNRDPSLIGKDQVAFAVNTTFRPGYATNRPGWSELTLAGDSFQLGRFQGAHGYIASNGRPTLIASIGGHIVRFDVVTNVVTDLSTTTALTNPANLPQAWMCQAEDYLPIQDNSSIPLIWDGALLRRAKPVAWGGTDLPTGNVMEYNNGRLWVALPDRRSFVAGDLAYSVTGQSKDVLSFTENQFLNGGGAFILPSTCGFITAMRTISVQDSVLGQGPLQVFGSDGCASINAPFDRIEWQNLNSPIETVSLMTVGPTSQEGTINVNGDIWYRSRDGIRSMMIARRDHGTWVNIPLSGEVDRILRWDDPYLMSFCNAVVFENRLLCAVSPYRHTVAATEYGVAWKGLVALDFSSVSSMFERTQPVWDGLWNGINILQILKVNCFGLERCFMFALNSCDEITLWELSVESAFDNSVDPIEWFIETRAMGFNDESESMKQLERTERWLDSIQGPLSFEIKYRPDSFWGWLPLDTGIVCATTGSCLGPGCSAPLIPKLQYRPRALSAGPDDSCEPCTNKPYRVGFQYAFRIKLNGSAALRRFRAVASEVTEDSTGGCLPDEDCCSQTGCEDDPWNYVTPEIACT